MDATRTSSAPLDPASMSPDALAAEVARRMWDGDRATQALGMELLEVRAGYARIRMPIRRDMTNGHGICHGGYMFLLADSTFAFACNSHNQRAVAASAEIHFIASAHEGDVLTAEGVEQHLAGRSGVYDMRVTDQTGRLIALFRGKSATIKGQFVEPPAGLDAKE
ncbi:MAG: hydroxyphenylacetyl-CoA thioesterase PaaI [Burkholderiales bacterium]|nr:MAG: hydroxyphenylacetyl-CoA thioesterase PaaI [Burkholderiales bacterium]